MDEFRWILTVSAILIGLKCLLIPTYTSTDFEVHRNWMAVTWQRPLAEWYTESTSEWTLDYPPFFAYFELILASVANALGIDGILEISEKPIMSPRILMFQRASVIVTDLFYITVCALYSFRSPSLVSRIPRNLKPQARQACFVLLTCLQALLMIDSVHFQYNSMLTAFFILSMYFMDQGRMVMAALCFSVLLNFKHIYVYYALGYVFYYLVNYFKLSAKFGEFLGNLPKAITLALSLLLPFAVSLYPFFHVTGLQGLQNIATRLFPVSRGLTHAYWAPNFWALYNFADLLIFRLLKVLKLDGTLVPPTYTSGLVQEYSHSVLPSVSPLGTLALVVISSIICLSGLIFNRKSEKCDFSLFAVFSALCFFYFGYHVHEKAIILVTVPMTVFAVKDPKYLRHLIFVSTISSFSLFPLLFTPFEILLKYAICTMYFCIQLMVSKRFTRAPLSDFLPYRHVASFGILAAVEVYNTFLHQLFFHDKLPFAPLMAISILNAVEMTSFFASLIWSTFLDGILETTWQKATCQLREQLIRDETYSVQSIEDAEDVQLVGGVDISASKTNHDMVIVSLSVWTFPQLRHVATVSDSRILRLPYIPQYLAVREAEVVAEFVKRTLEKFPELRPDVIMCDGFGQFHSRDCGMACHVGALTGIPSIGIAKNLTLHDVYNQVGMDLKSRVDEFLDSVREIFKTNQATPGYIPFDIVLPVKLNVLRMGGGMKGVFVSAGYGIDLELATQISSQMMLNNTTCEPIRAADLKSRELVREHYDGENEKID